MRPIVPAVLGFVAVVVAQASCGGSSRRSAPLGAGGGGGAAGAPADGGAPDVVFAFDAAGACAAAQTCASAGATCGPIGDGCGGVLQCGTCAPPETCGGGGTPSACGGPDDCVPMTCGTLGADCGPVADGCGGLIHCGACAAPAICGGGGTPSVCGPAADAGTCTNLCLSQVACDGGVTTTVTGVVYAPNGHDPLYDALVYVPNAPVAPFTPGVSCDQCGAQASGSPLVSTHSAADGTFTLQDVPAGQHIPLVIQIGRWRRQVAIPTVSPCVSTPLPASLTRLPRNEGEGDIPLMAFATGSVDALECVLRKIGVDDAEFTLPASQGGTGRINLYVSNGAGIGASPPPASQLWASKASLSRYDMVLFPCEGGELTKTSAAQQALIQYANAGGRVFATHYSFVWLYDDAPFSGTAKFHVDQSPLPDLTGLIDTTFQKGQAFAEWLVHVGASTAYGQIPLETIRHDIDAVVSPSQRWIYADPSVVKNAPMHYTFNTPVGAPASAQCGRVLFDDFHVEDAVTTGLTFPEECAGGPMTPQEKVLEFMIFDLSSCITPDGPSPPTCTPRTCAQQGAQCGPAGDGCGGVLQCGSCPDGQLCGGGGTPSVCGTYVCAPRTCADAGAGCGPVADGCGGLLMCGACSPPLTCGGGGKANQCGGASTR